MKDLKYVTVLFIDGIRKLTATIVFCVLLFGCFSSSLYASEKRFVLSYSPGTLFHQLVRDRARMAYEKAGFDVEFVELPHHRSLLSANNGTVDGDVGRVSSIEEKYPDLRRVNVKLMDLNGVAYTNQPEIKHYDESILKAYRVGYVLGVGWAEKKLRGLNATPARDYDALFTMLEQGRVDVVLATEASADAIVEQAENNSKIYKLRPFVVSEPIYHYVNKKNSNIIPQLEKSIAEINHAGVFIFYTGVKTPLLEILQARLQEAFRRIGKTCELRSVGSAQRSLMLANEQGDGDAARLANIKELAAGITTNLTIIPESIHNIEFYVYTNGKQIDLKGWDSLGGLRNGFRLGTKILEKNVPGEKIVLPDSVRLLKMLEESRLDTVVEQPVIADYMIQKFNLSHINKMTPSLISMPGYPMIHVKHKELVPRVAASLAEMKADGTFDQIKEKVILRLLQKQEN